MSPSLNNLLSLVAVLFVQAPVTANIILNYVPASGTTATGTIELAQPKNIAQVPVSWSFTVGGNTYGSAVPGNRGSMLWSGAYPALGGAQFSQGFSRFLYLSTSPELDSPYQVWNEDTGTPARGTGKGDWVVVPEPSTYLAGALVLLPLAAQSLRFVRKQRVV